MNGCAHREIPEIMDAFYPQEDDWNHIARNHFLVQIHELRKELEELQ
jgi:hypothetical protein